MIKYKDPTKKIIQNKKYYYLQFNQNNHIKSKMFNQLRQIKNKSLIY
jgi:hypothetical protein